MIPKNGAEDESYGIPRSEWNDYRDKGIVAMSQIQGVSAQLPKIGSDVSCLPEIKEHLASLPTIALTLGEIKTGLLAAAVNTDKVPLKVFLTTIGVLFMGFIFCLSIASNRSLETPYLKTIPVPVPVPVPQVTQ